MNNERLSTNQTAAETGRAADPLPEPSDGRAEAAAEDHYLGHWESQAHFAEELAIGLGLHHLLRSLPPLAQRYLRIDTELLVEDLPADYLLLDDPDRGVHVFERAATPEATKLPDPVRWPEGGAA